MSHALSLRLEFLRISSPSIDWLLTLPSGFKVDSSTSLKVACSLSPGIASISDAERRFWEPDEGWLAMGLSDSSSMSLSSSEAISESASHMASSSIVSSSKASNAARESES